jgi:hypothetical protein
MSKQKIQLLASVFAVAVTLVLGGVFIVKAFSGNTQTVIENFNGGTINNEGGSEGSLGAIAGPYVYEKMYFYGGYEGVDGTLTGDLSVTDQITQNGVVGDWLSGACTDATTTPFAILNPESANVVVDQFYLRVQNGTSTVNFTMGTSSTQYISADPTDLLIDDVSIATSTLGTATTTVYFHNQTDDGSTSIASGFTDAGTNAEPSILWASGEYITAFVTETDGGSGGWTGQSNMAECYYRIHYTKME